MTQPMMMTIVTSALAAAEAAPEPISDRRGDDGQDQAAAAAVRGLPGASHPLAASPVGGDLAADPVDGARAGPLAAPGALAQRALRRPAAALAAQVALAAAQPAPAERVHQQRQHPRRGEAGQRSGTRSWPLTPPRRPRPSA